MELFMYISCKELPNSIQFMLKNIGYNRHDINVNIQQKVSPFYSGQDGYRGVFSTVKISDSIEEFPITKGSFGGANMFTSNAVDSLDEALTIPENLCAFKGREGGISPTLGELYILLSNTSLMLPKQSTLSEFERKVLACYKGLTSAGRKEAFSRLKKSELENAQDSLLSLGFIIKKGNGVSITTEGKNALGDNYSHLLY